VASPETFGCTLVWLGKVEPWYRVKLPAYILLPHSQRNRLAEPLRQDAESIWDIYITATQKNLQWQHHIKVGHRIGFNSFSVLGKVTCYMDWIIKDLI
jgi:hypothetical protein